MKETTEVSTKQVEVKVTTYHCDHCDFSSKHKSDVNTHHAETHLCKGTKDLPFEVKLFRFDTKEDAREWINIIHHDAPGRDVEWDSPGWYKIEYYDNSWSDRCVQLVFDWQTNDQEHLSQTKVGDTYTDNGGRVWDIDRIDSNIVSLSCSPDYVKISAYIGGNIGVFADGASEDAVDYAIRLWKNRN